MPSTTSRTASVEYEAVGERRRETRVKTNIPAKVKGLQPLTSSGPYSSGRVVEISRRGLKLVLGREFLPGALIQVIAGKKAVLGQVRHCSSLGAEFVVGVRLVEGVLAVPGEDDFGVLRS